MIEAGPKLLLEIEENFFQAANSQAGLMSGSAQESACNPTLHIDANKTQFEFGSRGGTIGRNGQCELVLNSGSISSRHAKISFKADGFYLEDLQSRNGTRVEGALLQSHIEYRLSEGEHIQVASCRLTVLSISIPTPAQVDISAPVEPFDQAVTQVVTHIVTEPPDVPKKEEVGDPELNNTPEPVLPKQELPDQKSSDQKLPDQGLPAQMALPEDWMNQSVATPINHLPESFKQAAVSADAQLETPAKSIDKIVDPRSCNPRSSSATPSAENYKPRSAAHSPSDATTAELSRAFFEGLGVDAPEDFQFDKEGVKQLGKAFRVMTEGTSELLAARSFLKFAINANMTQFNTNPLKMGLKTDEALDHLMTHEQKMGLDRPASFKGVELAFKEAFGDLKMHEMGLLGGFQTTLQRLLAQLSPEHIETTHASRQGVMKNLPVVKEVRLWEVYREKYGELQSLVGEEGKPLADDDLDKDLIEVFADDMLDGYLGTIEEMVE